jgi:hypothetical protein
MSHQIYEPLTIKPGIGNSQINLNEVLNCGLRASVSFCVSDQGLRPKLAIYGMVSPAFSQIYI